MNTGADPHGYGAAAGAEQPRWLVPVAESLRTARPDQLQRIHRVVPPGLPRARRAAVLILFGNGDEGPDVLLIERSPALRNHAGQPAFPGGAADPADASPVATALREAQEEVGLDPRGVRVLTTGPSLYLPPSHYLVTPVLAWWHTPSPVIPVDPAETAAVLRIPLAHLAEPTNRVQVRYRHEERLGPAFRIGDMFIWGFTGGLLDALLRMGGWERPWLPAEELDPPGPAARVPGTSASGDATQARSHRLWPSGARTADGSASELAGETR